MIKTSLERLSSFRRSYNWKWQSQRWNCTHSPSSRDRVLNLDLREPATFCGHTGAERWEGHASKGGGSWSQEAFWFPVWLSSPAIEPGPSLSLGRQLHMLLSSGTQSILFTRNSYKEAPAASGFAKETSGTMPRSMHCQSPALGVIRVFALGFPICEMGTHIYNFAFIISSIWELWLLFGSPT